MSPLPTTPLLILLLSALTNGLKLTSLTNDHPHASIEPMAQPEHDGYGVDYSFPTHHGVLDDEERMEFYNSFITACRDEMGNLGYLCEASEMDRMEGNLFQPQRMKNYTELGFQKISTPLKLHESLVKYYRTADKVEDAWGRHNCLHASPNGNTLTYLNHWEASSQSINFDDEAGGKIRTLIWDEVQTILQQWSGVNLSPSSLYGKLYSNQSIIPPSVDSEPMIISALIRVSQDLVQPWITEVIAHDGKAYHISLEEGEMLLYEGASVIHGRPFHMNGVYASDVFVHFEPIGHYMNQPPLDEDAHLQDALENLYQQAISKAKHAQSSDDALKSEIIRSSMYPNYIDAGLHAMRWMQTHERTKLRFVLDASNLNAHTAAAAGDIEALVAIAEMDPSLIKKVDSNGWTPLHEAVRSEQIEVLKWLIAQGLDMNLRTHHGDGGSPLWWAKKYHGNDSKVVKYLESKGALEIAPDGGV